MNSIKIVKKFTSTAGLMKQLLSLVTKKSRYNIGSEETRKKKRRRRGQKVVIAPEGCIWVCVGEEKQRFVIKTEYANHPLFKMLLEDAETEYGFDDHIEEGPIKLPCDVNLFYKVLAEMESGIIDGEEGGDLGFGGCSPFSTPRCSSNHRNRVYVGSYGLLTPSRFLKMNHFYEWSKD